jgi:hypothetical protein
VHPRSRRHRPLDSSPHQPNFNEDKVGQKIVNIGFWVYF